MYNQKRRRNWRSRSIADQKKKKKKKKPPFKHPSKETPEKNQGLKSGTKHQGIGK